MYIYIYTFYTKPLVSGKVWMGNKPHTFGPWNDLGLILRFRVEGRSVGCLRLCSRVYGTQGLRFRWEMGLGFRV